MVHDERLEIALFFKSFFQLTEKDVRSRLSTVFYAACRTEKIDTVRVLVKDFGMKKEDLTNHPSSKEMRDNLKELFGDDILENQSG